MNSYIWHEQRGIHGKLHKLQAEPTAKSTKEQKNASKYNYQQSTDLDLESTPREIGQITREKGERQEQPTGQALNRTRKGGETGQIKLEQRWISDTTRTRRNRLLSFAARTPLPIAPSLPLSVFETVRPKWNGENSKGRREGKWLLRDNSQRN